ncbi:hypothetical protein ACFQI7_37315 [Paenibacillus allorhizosphaerae]|uniref:YvlB/LiaX N-terminal domain-containing protein n=1 Tax=Paenibacillus allorhizosphaerae TaxID=2849866 RepID=A0ABM8VUU8_9BACL|nr:hypothetical protein [Paenibacillus allorhizosphaerae]CAG7659094.1 hypothetical protein PAECIP111802_07364 [Paenibacillus allorhizosphaerae]
MKEEISKVLSMMQEGKIDSDKASELIDALKEKQTAHTSQAVQVLGKPDYSKKLSSASGGYLDKTLKIRVTSQENDNININLPIKPVKAVLGAGHSIASNIPQAAKYVKVDMASHLNVIIKRHAPGTKPSSCLIDHLTK